MIYNFTTKKWENGPVLPTIRVGPVPPQPSVKVVSAQPKATVKVKKTFYRNADDKTIYDNTGHKYSNEKEFLNAGGKWNEVIVKPSIKVQPIKPQGEITKVIGAPPSQTTNWRIGAGLTPLQKIDAQIKVGLDPIREIEKENFTPSQRIAFNKAQLATFISSTPTSDLIRRKYGANVLTNIAGFAFDQIDPLVRDVSDISLANKVADGVARGEIDPSVLEGIEVLKKTNLQVIGDVASAVLVADLGLGAGGLAFKSAQKQAMKEGLIALAKVGGKETGLQGFQYGVAQAMSSGSTDINEITKIIATNTVFGAALGVGSTTAIPALAKIIQAQNQAKKELVQSIIRKGYTEAEATKLANQGGYIGDIPNKKTLNEFEAESLRFTGEESSQLEDQYKRFKQSYGKFSEPPEDFASWSKLNPQKADDLFYSRELTADDVYETFVNRYNAEKTNQARQVVPRNALSQTPQSKQSKKIATSQLATQNLARSVAKREPLRPVNIKPVSYADSITKPIISQGDAKLAVVRSEIGDVKVPKYYSNLVKDIESKAPTGKQVYKDISGFTGQARDVYRNFQSFFKDKFPEAKKQILDPFDSAKGKMVSEQKRLLTKLRTVTEGLGIKKGSKESAAVMDYGEKLTTKESLVKKFGQVKADKIVEADKFFRKEYDQLLDEVNAVRKEIYPNDETKIIPKRQDYYRHFQELSGLGGLKNIFESPANIDPQLVGVSAFTTPRSKWLAFAQRRVGFKSDRDAVGGFLEYIPSATYAKHIDPQIGNFRRLAQDLAIQTGDSKNANNFIEFLQDFSNDLAGKTNAADRFIQKAIPGGRKMMGAINWLNQRVKANTILGNASSTIAQIFNVPQGIASAKQYSVPGVLRTMGGIFAENVPMSKSSFINERYINSAFNAFDERLLAKPKRFAQWSLGVFDELGTKFIWNAHYTKGVAKKVADPVKYADDITRSLVAGRGIGEVPLIQKSKIFQILAPFQLEVGNLWYVMGDMVKAKDFGGIAVLFAANFLFNRVAEKVRGSDVTFDPLNALYEGILALQAEEDKKRGVAKLGGRLVGEVASNVPFGQTLASMYPEYGFEKYGDMTREELFGKGDPTRFGSGLLVTKALKDPLFKILPPFGGSQIKKSIEGLGAYSKGRVTNKEGETQFTIDKNPLNAVRSLLFGKYATPEAQKSFDEDKKPTSPMKSTYERVQELKSQGKPEEAVKLFDNLSPADQEVYQTYRKEVLKEEKEKIKPQVFETYKKVQELKAEGKDAEAVALYENLPKLEQEVYKTLRTKYKDTKLADLADVGREKDEPKDDKSFIKDVMTYAKALGTDPVTAFNRIIAGERIKRVDNGTIIVERIPLAESQSVKSTRGSSGTLKLDHTIPLQLGGSNSEDNLKLITEKEWESYTPIENKLGSLLKKGAISKKEAQQLIKDFKAGKIQAEEIMRK